MVEMTPKYPLAARIFRRLRVLVGSLAVGTVLALVPVSNAGAVGTTSTTAVEAASAARASGDLDSAVITLKNELQKSPKDLQARLLLGEIYLQQGVPLAAQKELEVAKNLGANGSRISALMAQAYLLQAQYQDALDEIGGSQNRSTDNLDTLLIRGHALMGLNRLDEANAAFNQALKLAPKSAEARVGLGRSAMHAGNYHKAAADFDAVLADDPGYIDAWIAHGELAQAQGDLAGAVKAYSTAIDIIPKQIQVRMYRAAANLDMGRLDDALKDVDFVLGEVDYEPQALYMKAQILARKGQKDEAQKYMQKAGDLLNNADQQLLSSFPAMLRLAGVVNAALNQNVRAMDFLQKYLVRFPNDATTLRWLAALSLRQDKPADAVPFLKRLLKINADDVAALNLMGIVQARLKRFDAALPYFERATNLAPDNSVLYQGLGGSYLSMGDVHQAISVLSNAVQREPTDVSSVIMLVFAYIRNNDTQAARKALQKASESWPKSPLADQLAGAIDIADADFAGARKHLKAALKVDEDFTPARLALAKISLQTQDYDQAAKAFSAILEKDKNNLSAIEGLGAANLGMGQLDDAAKSYERALEVSPADSAAAAALIAVRVRQGASHEGEKVARDFLNNHPASLPVINAYARILNESGRIGATVDLYRDAIAASAPQPLLNVGLAKAQFRFGDEDGAYQTLEKAAKAFPASPALFKAYVSLALENKDFARAQRVADQYIANQPDNPEAVHLKGEILLTTRQYKAAYKLFASVPKDKVNGDVLIGRLKAGMALGHGQEELPPLKEWVHQHPGDTNAKAILAGAYQAFGDRKAAIREYEELRPRLPNHAILLNNLAWLYYLDGNPKAVPTAAKAYELRPENANILDTYGWVLTESGDAAKGLPLLRKARAKDASSSIIQFHTGVALYELGRMQDAQRELESALSSGHGFDGMDRARTLLTRIKEQ